MTFDAAADGRSVKKKKLKNEKENFVSLISLSEVAPFAPS